MNSISLGKSECTVQNKEVSLLMVMCVKRDSTLN